MSQINNTIPGAIVFLHFAAPTDAGNPYADKCQFKISGTFASPDQDALAALKAFRDEINNSIENLEKWRNYKN